MMQISRDEAQNKKAIQAYVEAFNAGDFDRLRTLFAPDATVYGVLGHGSVEDVMPIWRELYSGLGMHLTIDAMAAEGDTVAVRYTETGTFTQPFQGREPTGKSYKLVAMEWFTFRDGKITCRWGARDAASQARQLGME